MRTSSISRLTILIFVFAANLVALDKTASSYQKGTITTNSSNTYDLKGPNATYWISHCGDFQNGQEVGYRLKEDQIYISREGGKEYKCAIKGTTTNSSTAESQPDRNTHLKGTILGYEALYRISKGSTNSVRRANVYDLRGTDLIYQIDFCGAFQAGQFTAGQAVQYRVDGERLYILRDNGKEYNCQIEGTQKLDAAPDASQAGNSSANSVASSTTAMLSITSIPDGADINVDGNFAGNTPSDIAVPEGDHSITVKKSGYKDWERKLKLAAGSNIHLSAEMEKTTP